MTQHGGGQTEELSELTVPRGQSKIGVKDGDALPRVVECMLQLIAARLDRRGRFVDELERRLP